MFEECKQYCDYLIVGLCTNSNSTQPEKNVPVETIFERYIRLRAIKYIDEIFVYENVEDMLALMTSLFGKYGENLIRFVDEKYRDTHYKEFGLDLLVHFTMRRHNLSSTNLRKRIYEAELHD